MHVSRVIKVNCAVLGYYTACSVSSLPTFRDKNRSHLQRKDGTDWLSSLNMGPIGSPETSVRYRHYSLRNNPFLVCFAVEVCNHADALKLIRSVEEGQEVLLGRVAYRNV